MYSTLSSGIKQHVMHAKYLQITDEIRYVTFLSFYVIIDGSVGVYITENPGDGDDDHTDHDDWEDDDDEGEESDNDHDDHDDGFGSRDQSRDPSPDQSEEAELTPKKPLTFKQIVCAILNRKQFGKRVTTLSTCLFIYSFIYLLIRRTRSTVNL